MTYAANFSLIIRWRSELQRPAATRQVASTYIQGPNLFFPPAGPSTRVQRGEGCGQQFNILLAAMYPSSSDVATPRRIEHCEVFCYSFYAALLGANSHAGRICSLPALTRHLTDECGVAAHLRDGSNTFSTLYSTICGAFAARHRKHGPHVSAIQVLLMYRGSLPHFSPRRHSGQRHVELVTCLRLDLTTADIAVGAKYIV